MSNSLRPHESQHARPPCPSPAPVVYSTHAHRVGDAIQPSHPLSSPSPLAPNPSQHQGLFQWVNSLHEVAKVLGVSASAILKGSTKQVKWPWALFLIPIVTIARFTLEGYRIAHFNVGISDRQYWNLLDSPLLNFGPRIWVLLTDLKSNSL